jgi:hypothetical protein
MATNEGWNSSFVWITLHCPFSTNVLGHTTSFKIIFALDIVALVASTTPSKEIPSHSCMSIWSLTKKFLELGLWFGHLLHLPRFVKTPSTSPLLEWSIKHWKALPNYIFMPICIQHVPFSSIVTSYWLLSPWTLDVF